MTMLTQLQAVYPPKTSIVIPPLGSSGTTTSITSSNYSPTVGVPFTLSGLLMAGANGLDQKIVSIDRQDSVTGHTTVAVNSAITSNGTWTVSQSENVAGYFYYTANFAGDQDFGSSLAKTSMVTVGVVTHTTPTPVTPIPPGSHPGVATNGSTIWIFVRGTNNALYYKTYGSATWTNLAGTLHSSPSALHDGTYVVGFVLGEDKNHNPGPVYGKSSVGNWVNMGGTTGYGPASSSWGGGREDIFAIGTNNGLYHRGKSDLNSKWSSWSTALGGTWYSDLVATAPGTGGLIAVFGLGGTGHVYMAWTDDGGSTVRITDVSSSPTLLSGTCPGACSDTSYLHLFITAADNQLYHKICTISNGHWSAWEPVGCPVNDCLTGAPSAVKVGSTIHVFARNNNKNLAHISGAAGSYGSTTWGGWDIISGGLY